MSRFLELKGALVKPVYLPALNILRRSAFMKRNLFSVLSGGIVTVFLLVSLLTVLAACSGAGDESSVSSGTEEAQPESAQKTFNVNGSGKVIGVATQHMGNAWNKNSVQAIKDVLEPYGFRINHQDGGGNTSAQVAAVETFITQGVDYIIVSGGEGGAFNAVSVQAHKAGIPVVAIDMFLDGGITGIMCDNWSGGVQMGIYAVNQMKGEGKYILLDTSGWATLLDRGEGAESVLSSFSKIRKIGSTREVAASDPVTQGYQITKAALQADPDIKAVLVTWNMPAIGVYNALAELNKINQVTIISADTGDDVITAMLENGAGAWGFMGQNSYELGTLAADSVLTHASGGTVPFAQIGTTYFVTNDDYIKGDIKTVKIQDPQEHWKEVLEPVLGPLQID
jgi:ribose transport system substrate-binding protein